MVNQKADHSKRGVSLYMSSRHADEEIPLRNTIDYDDSDASKEPPPSYSEATSSYSAATTSAPLTAPPPIQGQLQPTVTPLPTRPRPTPAPRRRSSPSLLALVCSGCTIHIVFWSLLGLGFFVAGIVL